MPPAIELKTLSAKFWKVFDDLDDSRILEETEEERRLYDETTRNEIGWKIQSMFKSDVPTTIDHVTKALTDGDPFIEYDICSAPVPSRNASINAALTGRALAFTGSQPTPSFDPSLMGKTSTPRAHRIIRHKSMESVSEKVYQSVQALPSEYPALCAEKAEAGDASSSGLSPKSRNQVRMGSELPSHNVFPNNPAPLASCITSIPVTTSSATPLPSFRQSQFGKVSTPHAANVTFPDVPTPSFDEYTPAGPSTRSIAISNSKHPHETTSPRRRAHTVDTPENIPSPVDTPDTARAVIGAFGRSPRDDPATPGPLGLLPLKGGANKRFQNVSKHFQIFVAKKEGGAAGGKKGANEKGKQPMEKIPSHGLGGGILRGLRICLPPGDKPMSIQQQAWDQVGLNSTSSAQI